MPTTRTDVDRTVPRDRPPSSTAYRVPAAAASQLSLVEFRVVSLTRNGFRPVPPVGLGVGVPVGDSVGVGVGLPVGLPVGDGLFVRVGLVVGVGLPVGLPVGDGLFVRVG